MRSIGRFWLVSAVILLHWAVAWAAEPQFVSVGEAAIPRSVVAALAQDQAGFLWLATGDGVVRYDGYRFQPQQRHGLPPAERNLGWVRAMLGARDGRVWIGTESDGLAVYDPQTDRITAFASDRGLAASDGPSLAPPVEQALRATIRAIAEDRDGSLWIGTQGAGLVRLDPATGQGRLYGRGAGPGAVPDDRVLSLLVDSRGQLWVGTWHGLVRRQPGSDRFEAVATTGIVQALHESSDGQIWVGTQGGQLLRLDPQWAQPGLPLADPEQATAPSAAVTSFSEAPSGRLWVGRNAGMELRDTASGALLHRLRQDQRRPGGLKGSEITALLRDRAGSVWVASLGGGLQRHDPPRPGLTMLVPEDGDNPSVRSVLARRDGSIWAATEAGPVLMRRADLRPAGQWSLPAAAGQTAPRVQAMAERADGSVWLATGDNLLRVNDAGRVVQSLPHVGGQVYRLQIDRDGHLWLCAEGGLYRLDAGGNRLQRVPGLAGGAHVAAHAPDGSLWVGGTQGLHRIAPGGTELQAVDARDDARLGNPVVIGLLFDGEGTLWVDTAISGLHRLQSGHGALRPGFDRISERHGVVGRPFGANLLQDDSGRIWSQQYVYDPAADRLDELVESDGRHLGTGWFHAYAQTVDGRMLFGGSQGLLVVQPEAFEAQTQAPPLVLSGLLVNGVRQPASPTLKTLALQPEDRSFSVEFAALDYSQPSSVRYAYRLEGFDPDWIATSADMRLASYSNLDPGSYRLRVRATSRSGVDSERELDLALNVEPAWWQRPETRALAAVLALGGLWAWVQWRTVALRRQRRVLEALVAERTAALQASSLTDPLTGLHNRRFVSEEMPAEIARSLRRHGEARRHPQASGEGSDLLFFLVDIDHFKAVNDRHGHAAGDAVLVQMAARLKTAFRLGDPVVRWGGEEFLVLARDTPRGQAAEMAERVRAAVADQPFSLDDGQLLRCSCSVGFAVFPLAPDWPQALPWSTVLNLADAALFLAKERGRNGWVGLVGARAASDEALRAAAAQPLAQWQASGLLDTVTSTHGSAGNGPRAGPCQTHGAPG